MPIYEYKCTECNEVFEYFQSISDKELKACMLCGKKDGLSKIISSSGFRLKGSGWYETDFKTGSKKNIVDTIDEKDIHPKDKTKKTDKSKSKSSDKKT